jgi:hypothetical protein
MQVVQRWVASFPCNKNPTAAAPTGPHQGCCQLQQHTALLTRGVLGGLVLPACRPGFSLAYGQSMQPEMAAVTSHQTDVRRCEVCLACSWCQQ